jgi:lambda family phage portal protein
MRNLIDAVIEPFAPEKALKRAHARAKLQNVKQYAGLLGGTGPNGQGYGRHGANTKKKGLIGWLTSLGSPGKDIDENQPKLVERSRDLFMSAPLATGALKTIRTNVVGGGLRLHAAIDFDFLGMTAEQAEQWHKNTEREFRLWADTTACDAYRRMTFGQLQSLALLMALKDGDCFAALPVKARMGMPYDLRIKLIEGDLVSTPNDGSAADADVLTGIELDADGEAVAAWVANGYSDKLLQRKWQRVRFFGEKTGAPQLLHIAQDWERAGQRRGVPLLAPVIETLKQLTRLTEAELTAYTINSFFTVFITSQTPQQPLQQQYAGEEQIDAADPNSYEIGSGTMVGLEDGEKAELISDARSNTSFEPFVKAICQQIGAGIELPYELLMKHFTASYSASRAALLEAWKMFRMRRVWLVDCFTQPIYEQWLAEAVAKGRIKADGYFTDPAVRAAWSGAYWNGPGQGHLNPLGEARAQQILIEEELTTRKRAAAEIDGVAWEDIHPERAREETLRRADKTIKKPGEYGSPTGKNPVGRPPDEEDTAGEGEE